MKTNIDTASYKSAAVDMLENLRKRDLSPQEAMRRGVMDREPQHRPKPIMPAEVAIPSALA